MLQLRFSIGQLNIFFKKKEKAFAQQRKIINKRQPTNWKKIFASDVTKK